MKVRFVDAILEGLDRDPHTAAEVPSEVIAELGAVIRMLRAASHEEDLRNARWLDLTDEDGVLSIRLGSRARLLVRSGAEELAVLRIENCL